MTSPTQEDGEIKYRFSRPVRLWLGAITVTFFIGMTVTCVMIRAWEGVVGGVIGVVGVGTPLAQQLGMRTQLVSRLPQGPLSRLLVSLAVLALVAALVAVESGNTVAPVTVAGVFAALLLIQFWWAKSRGRNSEPPRP